MQLPRTSFLCVLSGPAHPSTGYDCPSPGLAEGLTDLSPFFSPDLQPFSHLCQGNLLENRYLSNVLDPKPWGRIKPNPQPCPSTQVSRHNLKTLHDVTPSYLFSLVGHHSSSHLLPSLPHSSHLVPPHPPSPVASTMETCPRSWDSLPSYLHVADNILPFRSHLKHHLLGEAFCDYTTYWSPSGPIPPAQLFTFIPLYFPEAHLSIWKSLFIYLLPYLVPVSSHWSVRPVSTDFLSVPVPGRVPGTQEAWS